jgi:hypothetical protein
VKKRENGWEQKREASDELISGGMAMHHFEARRSLCRITRRQEARTHNTFLHTKWSSFFASIDDGISKP